MSNTNEGVQSANEDGVVVSELVEDQVVLGEAGDVEGAFNELAQLETTLQLPKVTGPDGFEQIYRVQTLAGDRDRFLTLG